MKIGIIGAGRMAQAIGYLAIRAGHDVIVSNSRGAHSVREVAARIGARTGSADEAANFGEIIVVAIHLQSTFSLPKLQLDGKVVVNPQNYFPQFGAIECLDKGTITTAEVLAREFPNARVVKAFNSILAEEIIPDARETSATGRRALPIAGDRDDAKQAVAMMCDSLGYDTVDAGSLSDGWRFERRRPVYCVALDRDTLRERLESTSRDSFVPDGYWKVDRGLRT